MALCVCGWDADRENAMSIRPGQVIQVSEFAEHWSRGQIWEDPQVATMHTYLHMHAYAQVRVESASDPCETRMMVMVTHKSACITS